MHRVTHFSFAAAFPQLVCILVSISIASVAAGTAPQHPLTKRSAASGVQRKSPQLLARRGEHDQLLRRAAPSDAFTFSVTLHGNNMDGLTEKMYDLSVSNGNWLTVDELREYAAPHHDHAQALRAWLTSHHIGQNEVQESTLGDHFVVTIDVGTAEKMFGTELHQPVYTADPTNSANHNAQGKFYAKDGLKLPGPLQDAVLHVSAHDTITPHEEADSSRGYSPQLHFTPTTPPISVSGKAAYGPQAASASACNTSSISTGCIRSTYKIDGFQPKPKSGVVDLGIAGWLGEGFNQSSLTTYLKAFRPEAADYKVPVYMEPRSHITSISGEGDLDVQAAVGLAWPLNVTWYSLGSGDPTDKLLPQGSFEHLLSLPDSLRPSVISFSYSASESFADAEIAAATCAGAQKLAALGTTILFSSGDAGLGCTKTNDIQSGFPSSCPYIISVGGTEPTNYNSSSSIEPEALLGTNSRDVTESGVGISQWYDVPPYQKDLVEKYLSSASNTAKGHYRENGRFGPDISSLAARFALYTEAQKGWTLAQGTSVSAPILAAMLALVNAARREKGLDSVGFVHPQLYSGSYYDIKNGSVYSCQRSNLPGFTCTDGFDIAGLGSPRLTELFAALVG